MSTGVNVLRYGALLTGAAYGFRHKYAIQSSDRAAHEQREYSHKQQQIEAAKKEYIKRTTPQSENQVISDPMDPKFDFEAWVKSATAGA